MQGKSSRLLITKRGKHDFDYADYTKS